MSRTSLRNWFALAAITITTGALFVPFEATAAPQVSASVFGTSYGNNNGPAVVSSAGPVQKSSSGSGTLGSGSARASADFGVLRGYSEATAIAGSANFN